MQLSTASKMFCACANFLGKEDITPNTLVCPVCLGNPGTLPALNEQAVNSGLKLATGLQAQVNQHSMFDRKNYTYPDLPKGYQITQFHLPLAQHGRLVYDLEGETHVLRIHEMHLEEDTGKIMHVGNSTLVDYNRAGSPLVEIVSEPDLHSPAAAKAAVTELRLLVRSLGISDADMEKGHLRCDANISMRPAGSTEFFPKVEVKNLNSLRSIQRALEYEVRRQTELWNSSKAPSLSETRGWDERQQTTVAQRSKEGLHDYRYFPEPDLLPLVVSDGWLEEVKQSLPVLPAERRRVLEQEYDLPKAAAALLVERHLDDYFSEVISEGREWIGSTIPDGTTEEKWLGYGPKFIKLAVNWLDEMVRVMANTNSSEAPTAENFAEFLTYVFERRVNSTAAQKLLALMVTTNGDPSDILENENLSQVSDDTELGTLVDKIISENQQVVDDLRRGKTNALKFLVGAAMKASHGKSDPEAVKRILSEKLGLES